MNRTRHAVDRLSRASIASDIIVMYIVYVYLLEYSYAACAEINKCTVVCSSIGFGRLNSSLANY